MVVNNPNKINRIQGFKDKKLKIDGSIDDPTIGIGYSLDEVKMRLHLESLKDCSDLIKLLTNLAPCFTK